jgi:hypothetical protein
VSIASFYTLCPQCITACCLGKSTLQYTSRDCERSREAHAWFRGIKRRCLSYILRSVKIVKIKNALNGISLEKFITRPMPFDNKITCSWTLCPGNRLILSSTKQKKSINLLFVKLATEAPLNSHSFHYSICFLVSLPSLYRPRCPSDYIKLSGTLSSILILLWCARLFSTLG